MSEVDEEREEAVKVTLNLLEEWGSASKFIWFRELHRITDIDKGLLRNILNELKNQKKSKRCMGQTIEYFSVSKDTTSNAEM